MQLKTATFTPKKKKTANPFSNSLFLVRKKGGCQFVARCDFALKSELFKFGLWFKPIF